MTAMSVDASPNDLLGEVLVSRQPILDRHLMVVGHELLYREIPGTSPVGEADGIRAAATILIEGVLGLGRELLGEGEVAHVNVPVPLLVDRSLLGLPAGRVVLELHTDAVDSPRLRSAIAEHRAAGYQIALDGVTATDPRLTLTDAVDFVKVDVAGSGEQAALELIADLVDRDVVIIAEHVEEPAAFDELVAAGATFAQGFFFTRPRAVRGLRPVGLSSVHVRLLQECTKEEVDFDELEALIRSDLTLADRFLAMIASGPQRWGPVSSVRDGLLALGQRALQRWVRLLIMSAIVRDEHPEQLRLASVRAFYCEALEQRLGTGRALEAFAAGMFSILGQDAVLSEETLASLPVTGDVRAALVGRPGVLRALLDIQIAAEQADWGRLLLVGRELGLTTAELAAAHADALSWGHAIVDVTTAR